MPQIEEMLIDFAHSTPLHAANDGAREEERTLHVDREHPIERCFIDLRRGRTIAMASVVDENVDSTELTLRRGDCLLDHRHPRDICLDDEGAAPELPHTRGRLPST